MLIGLCGAAGSGKDTVAAILREKAAFYRVAFAEPLYQMVAVVTGLMPEDLQDREVKEAVIPWLGKSPRQMLQSLGTEWGRSMVKDSVWIDLATRRIEQLQASGRSVVVTDVRFENEAEAIRSLGGELWRVVRPAGCVASEAMRHSSEAGLSAGLIDREIANTGSLGDLANAVDLALRAAPAGIL
jgi:predicted kinase